MIRAKLAFLILLLALAPAWGESNVVFKKSINQQLLTIKAPAAYLSGGKKIFVDKSGSFKVYITYGELKIRANKAAYDYKNMVVELFDGFNGEYGQYKISGDYFRVNPRTGQYVGRGLNFGYLFATLHGEECEFYGDHILIQKISTSPLQYPIFNLNINRLEVYPGYSLASGSTLRFFRVPFYYIPLYIEDSRRSYFDLNFPAFEVKKDIFHSTHGAVHSHYFLNPRFFGDISLKSSSQDGGGIGIKQIVRLNDYHQMQLKYTFWEKAAAQTKFSYIFNYFDDPRKNNAGLSFRERQQMEEAVAGVPPNIILKGDYSENEEIKRSIVDRRPDLELTGIIYGTISDHQYTLTPSIFYGKIREKKIFPENQLPQDVNRNYGRIKGALDFVYYLETPRLSPFINKVLWSIDYEHSIYDPGDANRGLLTTSMTARRPVSKGLGIYYEAILTKTLLNYGQSPFFFEEYGRLVDSATFDLYLQLDTLIAGNQYIYDITNFQPYNEIYYFGIKAGNNYATLQFDRREESWGFEFSRKESAF